VHELIKSDLIALLDRNDPILSEFEETFAKKLFETRIRSLQERCSTARPYRSDRKSVLAFDDNLLYVARDKNQKVLDFSSCKTFVARYVLLLEHEENIASRMQERCETITKNRFALVDHIRSAMKELGKPISHTSKPSLWIIAQDNGQELVEFTYRKRYIKDVCIDLNDPTMPYNASYFAKLLSDVSTEKIDDEIEREEKREEGLRIYKLQRLFTHIDSRHTFRVVDKTINGELIDVEHGQVSKELKLLDDKTISAAAQLYRSKIDEIQALELLKDISSFPPKTSRLSPRYFFLLEETLVKDGDVLQLYSSRGKQNRIIYHLFKNGFKTQKIFSKAHALNKIGKKLVK
jgi:hypothetical protein